uniref:Uncharacterized protein n=1 Tax=Setaria italica TaxID=4555 RepID=K3XQE4_SETIT
MASRAYIILSCTCMFRETCALMCLLFIYLSVCFSVCIVAHRLRIHCFAVDQGYFRISFLIVILNCENLL